MCPRKSDIFREQGSVQVCRMQVRRTFWISGILVLLVYRRESQKDTQVDQRRPQNSAKTTEKGEIDGSVTPGGLERLLQLHTTADRRYPHIDRRLHSGQAASGCSNQAPRGHRL